jgi:pimeloyl-ACP methyl ester carboxylesterase
MTRQDLTFASGGADCAAWWYRPADPQPDRAPCVVMAHGFSMTRRDGMEPYAEQFANAGAHVLAFDYRFLGDSGGEPRQRFRATEQREDWRNAVAFARALDGVDPTRLVPWGFSFSGGSVVKLLADDLDAAAAIVLCPFVDGFARLRAGKPSVAAWIIPRALADLAGRHNLIPVTGPSGSRAAMSLPGEAEGFAASRRPDSQWRNEISPGVFATVALIRPVARARRIRVPLWVGRCADDITVDRKAIGRLVERAPRAELHEFPGDHFAPFHGDGIARVAEAQVAFLRETVLREPVGTS